MLTIWHHHQRIGTIIINQDDRWEFEYDADWDGFPIMPQIPVGQEAPKDVIHNRLIEWFMDNLLPEGAIRQAYAKKADLSEHNTWALLTAYGGDVAGALTILPEGHVPPDNDQKYTLIADHDLAKRIQQSKEGTPMMIASEVRRMSLAGAQDKMTIRLIDNNVYLPDHCTPSTHILKPDSINKDYPFCPANEYFCMQLAGMVGLNVPETYLLSFAGYRAYIVDRYDRERNKEGHIERLHQVDACQALGLPKSQKYEDEGGLNTVELITQSVAACDTKAKTKSVLLDWVIYNYLIGNSDAHAKNFSFMVTADLIGPAPLYDLVCVEAYHQDNRLASSLAGEMKAGFVEGAHWDAFSLLCGIHPKLTRKRLALLSKKAIDAAVKLHASQVFTAEEEVFLSSVVDVVKQRAHFIAESLSSPLRSTRAHFSDLNDQGLVIDESILALLSV